MKRRKQPDALTAEGRARIREVLKHACKRPWAPVWLKKENLGGKKIVAPGPDGGWDDVIKVAVLLAETDEADLICWAVNNLEALMARVEAHEGLLHKLKRAWEHNEIASGHEYYNLVQDAVSPGEGGEP